MNGHQLCALGKENFLQLAPDFVGDILWEHLDQMMRGKFMRKDFNAIKTLCSKAVVIC